MMEYLISLIVVGLTMALGSFVTSNAPKTEWYSCIKPKLTPPNYVFPIVWSILYVIMFFAFAMSLQKRYATINVLFGILFALNVLWSYAYFAKRSVWTAFLLINLIVDVNMFMIYLAYRKKDFTLVLLLVPHLLWVSFASILNMLSLRKAKECAKLR